MRWRKGNFEFPRVDVLTLKKPSIAEENLEVNGTETPLTQLVDACLKTGDPHPFMDAFFAGVLKIDENNYHKLSNVLFPVGMFTFMPRERQELLAHCAHLAYNRNDILTGMQLTASTR